MPRVPELGRRRRGDVHQEPASGSTGCPEHGPRLRGSAPSPKALWSQGSDSEKRCPGEATLQSCSLKNLSNKDLRKQAPGRASRRLNTTGPASGARGRCQASLRRGGEQFRAPAFWVQRPWLRASTVSRSLEALCEEEQGSGGGRKESRRVRHVWSCDFFRISM